MLNFTLATLKKRALVPGVLLVSAISAHAQIIRVTGSAVNATFTSQNGAFNRFSPNAGFTYPGARSYAFNDLQPLASRTIAATAITGGFVIATRGSVASPFIQVPLTSYLRQGPNAVGAAALTLNFSINYLVGNFGVAAGITAASYQVFGNIGPAFGDYARLRSNFNFSKVGGPFLGSVGFDTGVLTRASLQVNPLTGVFNFPIVTFANIAGFNGAGLLNVNGSIRWEGDPSEIDLGSQTVTGAAPEPSTYAMFGLGACLLFVRRRRRK